MDTKLVHEHGMGQWPRDPKIDRIGSQRRIDGIAREAFVGDSFFASPGSHCLGSGVKNRALPGFVFQLRPHRTRVGVDNRLLSQKRISWFSVSVSKPAELEQSDLACSMIM